VQALIVEHNAIYSASLATHMQQHGYTPAAVDSAQQARHMLAAQSFDVALLGLELPDSSGFRLCAEIRERIGDEIVIILLVNHNTPLQRTTGLQLGADDVVETPYDAEELLARIDVHRQRRTTARARIIDP
jgi:two-component system response regulator VicR